VRCLLVLGILVRPTLDLLAPLLVALFGWIEARQSTPPRVAATVLRRIAIYGLLYVLLMALVVAQRAQVRPLRAPEPGRRHRATDGAQPDLRARRLLASVRFRAAVTAVIYLGALAYALQRRKRKWAAIAPLLLVVAYLTTVHVATNALVRYRAPLMPLVVLVAAAGWHRAAARRIAMRGPARPRVARCDR
jgi:hypothetical protein